MYKFWLPRQFITFFRRGALLVIIFKFGFAETVLRLGAGDSVIIESFPGH